MEQKCDIKVIHKGDVFNTLYTAKKILETFKFEFMHIEFNGFSICVHPDSNLSDLIEIHSLKQEATKTKKK